MLLGWAAFAKVALAVSGSEPWMELPQETGFAESRAAKMDIDDLLKYVLLD